MVLNCCDSIVNEPCQKLSQPEKYLYKIWVNREFPQEHLQTIVGKKLSIVNSGTRNESAGPDFLEAVILLEDELKSGDIEIHNKNKEWYFHGHDNDAKYDNVILHVIREECQEKYILNSKGEKIDVFHLPLKKTIIPIIGHPCKNWTLTNIQEFDELINDYARKRFQYKTINTRKALLQYQPEQYFFIGMLDVMGYSKNRIAMKSIAKNLDIDYLYQLLEKIEIEKRLLFLEAILLGIAGLLKPNYQVYYKHKNYFEALQKYWTKISKKYDFKTVENQKFHFAGNRPANYPHKRLIGLAQIINNIYPEKPGQECLNILFSGREPDKILLMLKEKFQIPSGMWKNHPLFKSHKSSLLVGNGRMMDFLTNILLPFARAMSSILKEEQNTKFCTEFNKHIPVGEVPGKIKKMLSRFGKSQSMIKTNYCLQGLIEYHRLFCDLDLCNICLLENIIESK